MRKGWFLTNKEIEDIRNMAAQGMGKHLISRKTGVSRLTVIRYIRSMKNPPSKCACGRDYHHNGRCAARRKFNGTE